ATDEHDPFPMLTNDAPAMFTVGTTTVTWTAADINGHITTKSSTVTITCPAGMACTPIVITPPAPLQAEATTSDGSPRTNSDIAAWLASVAASDTEGVAEITHDAPEVFGFGTTTVTFTAVDGRGH